MTSPAPEMDEPFEDESELLGTDNDVNQEEGDGEELFGDNMEE